MERERNQEYARKHEQEMGGAKQEDAPDVDMEDAAEEEQGESEPVRKSSDAKVKEESKDKDSKKNKKSKSKAVEKQKQEQEPVEEAAEEEAAEEVEEPAAFDQAAFASNHVQSERNARRRMHREFLRKVEERRETSASVEQKSIAVYGLAADVTEKVLYKKVRKIAAVTKIELKAEPTTNKPYAVVQLEHLRDVATAVQKLDQHVFKGATLKVVQLADMNRVTEGRRLIIRNLSFQATDADLDKMFTKVGALSEAKVVRLPLEDPDNAPEGALGKSRGFGFVQFYDSEDAKRAIEQLNGTRLKGRDIVVDMAVTKNKYLQMQNEAAEAKPSTEDASGEDVEDENEKEGGDEDEDEDEEDEEDEENVDAGSAEMEEDDDAEADEDDSDVDMDDEDSEDEDEEEHERHITDDSEEQRARTVFLRNISFQTTEDSMKDFFRQFGKVDYARIVMDKETGLSKGVGFVRFHEQDAANVVLSRGQHGTLEQKNNNKKKENAFALSAMADGDALMLDGRMLIVSQTVSKTDATQLAESNSSQRKQRDKRNMYLAYEGTISVNKVTDEELGLPRLDIEKRRRAIKEKKEKLKNPMYFVSPLRLSVRNIASYVDDKQLKSLFRDAAVKGIANHKVQLKEIKDELRPSKGLEKVPVKVKMAKIVRDMENVKPGKEPRSRGYGFVEFVEHVHALAALRVLNNNPEFTSFAAGGSAAKAKKRSGVEDKDKSRLIVEFALENHGKLRLREKKKQDAQKKRDEEKMLQEAQGGEDNDKKKKSRGQRQRENKRARAMSDEPVAASDAEAKVAKPAKAKQAKDQVSSQKKRKRSEKEEKLVERSMGKEAKSAKTLSRKERKRAKADAQEQSFDALVQDYKKQLFGEKSASRAGDSEGKSERWFD